MVRQYSFNVEPPERAVARVDSPPPAQGGAAPPAPAAQAVAPKQAAAPKPAAKPKEKVAAKAERPRPSAGANERDVATAEGRVKDLERTMRELQEKIDARTREIEALQRQVGGTAK
jgi:predicted RNase H-like nuclease (RuvC/YqgF family)